MKLLAVLLLVSSVTVQASGNPAHFGSIQTSITCPSPWTPINDRCFLYVPNTMTWANAEMYCLSMGAHLASVHNPDEYRQVQTLIAAGGHWSTLAWIGGSDGQQENFWFWSDGSRMSYTNWCYGQPDNGLGNQHCLQMNYESNRCWDDCWCHFHRSFVCAKKP